MSFGAIAVGVISIGATAINNKNNRDQADRLAGDAEDRYNREQALLEIEKQKYRDMEFSNPYADIQTSYENTYEDVTVNQQQAQFQAQQAAQSRSNITYQMAGAAGGSGIASLAQAMANQGQMQTQQISASIGQQEAMNQRLRAQGAQQAQAMEQRAEFQIGAGNQFLQQQEADRAATLVGVQMGSAAGASQGYQNALLNQQQVDAAASQAMMGSLTSLASTAITADYSSLSKTTDPNQTYDLSRSTLSGTGVNNINPLYQSPADSQGGMGAFRIDQFGNTQFNNLSGMSIYDQYDEFGNKINK